MQKEDLSVYSTPEELAKAFADQLIEWIRDYSGETYHLAISGGKTPNLLFDALASKYANTPIWHNVHFWWVDERMVAPTHPESNFGIAQRLLFSQIRVPEGNIHRIKGENNPDKEALSYSTQISNNVPMKCGWPRFDLILLGMGDDGHTASIFSNQLHLLNSDKICEVAMHPQSGQKRVTLTGKAINQAARIVFLVTGEGKASRLNEIYFNKPGASLLPAYHIPNARWFVDRAASSQF